MFGASLRCPVCNQYAPDRCTCKKESKVKTRNADGASGILLNPYNNEGKWVFRIYEGDGTFKDYDLDHSDLCVTIEDIDACFYEHEDGTNRLDHSPETLGKTGE